MAAFKRTINNRKHHYCRILGVNASATKEEIKNAFYRLANDEGFRPQIIREREGREPTTAEKKRWEEIHGAWRELYAKEESARMTERANEESRKMSEAIEEGEKEFKNRLLNVYLPSCSKTIKELADLNKKTQQLIGDALSLTSRCWCHNSQLNLSLSWDFWKGSSGFFHIWHLKTRQEIEEFVQRVIKIDKEINEEVARAAMAVDEARKKMEENKNDIDNKQQPVSTSNEKRDNSEPITDKETEQEEVNNDNNSQEPKRAKIETEVQQDQTKKDEEVTNKLINDLAGLANQSELEKEQSLVKIEKLKNQGGVYEQVKEKVKEKKDELAKKDPQGYGRMIAEVIKQKMEEFKVEVAKLGSEIKEKIQQLKNGEITSDEQVREIEEEVSEKVSEEVANVETNDLLTHAQQLLSKQTGILKSQLEKIKKDLYSLKLSTNPFQQKAYELKKTEFDQTLRDVERHLNQNQTVKPNPTPWGVIIPASLAAVVLAGIVGAVIARRKNRARVK